MQVVRIATVVMALFLVGCGDQEKKSHTSTLPDKSFGTVMAETADSTIHDVGSTVKAPFEDVNIINTPIPERLQQIALDPYRLPAPPLCATIPIELAELETLLGPDVDNSSANAEASYAEQGIGMARGAATGVVRSHISIIPFEGVVRRVSGAERHAREVEKAYQAGRLRRAFLKGLGKAYHCPAVCKDQGLLP